MEDPNFVVQGLWSDGRIAEEDGEDDLEKAIKMAERMTVSPLFEGTAVRVLTRDGETEWAWESPKHNHPTIEKKSHGWIAVGRLQACFKGDSGEDLIVFGDVNLPPVLSGPNCEFEAIPSHVQLDEPAGFPNLGRSLSEAEDKRAQEALFQEACDRVRRD